MSCKRYDETVIAVALGAAGGHDFERHVSGCPSCRTKLDEATLAAVDMDRDLRTLLSVSPAADFTARVTTRALNESPGHAWIQWVAAAAVCAALVLAAAAAAGILDRSTRGRDLPVSGSSTPVAPPSGVEPPVGAVARSFDRAPAGRPSISLDRAPQRRPVRRSRATAASSPTREVIVQSGQLRAVRRLVTAVAQGRFAMEESTQRTAEPAIAPMTVQPILIREIEVLDAASTPRSSLQGGE